MTSGLFGPDTMVGLLRASLSDQGMRHREISMGVANFMTIENTGGFAASLSEQLGDADSSEPDLMRYMVELTDSSMRYDVAARLLRRAYDQYRTAIRNA